MSQAAFSLASADTMLADVRQELARRKLLDFIKFTFPSYLAGWFHREVCDELDRFLADVRAKKSPRLILQAPPRHGKTEIVSVRFPAFALGQDPNLSVIATSYASELASRNNREVQRVMEDEPYKALFPDTTLWAKNIRTVAFGTYMRNSDLFEVVGKKGIYRAAGVCGGITGMGAHILIIDDPIKDDIEASSEVYRERVWNWYASTAYTRLAPGGGVLVIMTRWHEDDLVGRLIKAMEEGNGDKWRVCRYPAVAESDEPKRKEGEALHPERYPRAQLDQIRQAVGSRVWISLYQQRPTAAEGQILKRAFWRFFKPPTEDPRDLIKALGITRVLQAWDTGFKTKAENDPSAGVTLGLSPNKIYLLDVWRRRVEYPDLKRSVVAQHAKWRPYVLLIEDAASGQSLVQELKRETPLPIIPIKPDRDKVARANAITPQLEAGTVYLPEGAPWLADFMDECAGFPNAAHDDQVDAFTMGLGYLVGGGGGLGMYEFMRDQAEKATLRANGGAA